MVRPALERTLKALKLDYVDLYIIEIPMAFKVSSGTHLQLRALYSLLLFLQEHRMLPRLRP